MINKTCYNIYKAVAGRPETNDRSAIVPVSGVLAADPIDHIVGFGELLPATGYTSYRGDGAFYV